MRLGESSILGQYAIKKALLSDEYPQGFEVDAADFRSCSRHLDQLFVVGPTRRGDAAPLGRTDKSKEGFE